MFTCTRCPAARGARVQVGATTPAQLPCPKKPACFPQERTADVAAHTAPPWRPRHLHFQKQIFFKKGKHTNMLRCSGTTTWKNHELLFKNTMHNFEHDGKQPDGKKAQLMSTVQKIKLRVNVYIRGRRHNQ